MHQIKPAYLFFMLALIAVACIKPYYPDIEVQDTDKYVVSGEVDDLGGIQEVTVSKASPLQEPRFIGVPFCTVSIFDDHGHEFTLDDHGDGRYTTYIDPSLVVPGALFRVSVYTPEGDLLESDYDSVSSCPGIDSVYYIQKSIATPDPNVFNHGIQYYVNLNGSETDSRYYRWDITETWEYHVEYAYSWYYDGSVHQIWPPDSSRMVCWRTRLVESIFTLSTHGLTQNKYYQLPLHFVDNKSPRLSKGYSVLVKQYALSEKAYVFWDKMRVNSSGQGGLYEKQPMPVKGNVHNLTHPEKDVLGYFGIAKVTTKRVFTRPLPGLVLDYPSYCSPQWLPLGFKDISPYEYPAALLGTENYYMMYVMNPECYDCTKLGGTTVKPDFWPN